VFISANVDSTIMIKLVQRYIINHLVMTFDFITHIAHLPIKIYLPAWILFKIYNYIFRHTLPSRNRNRWPLSK